jgi:hypothetical protein
VSKIYELRSKSRGDGAMHTWGARASRADAEQLLRERTTGENAAWAAKYHEHWWIEEIDTTGLFTIPSRPAPRERFTTRTTVIETQEGYMNHLRVDVVNEQGVLVTSYERNHAALYRTFEPFRQRDRMLALVASDYTAMSVIDLATGEVIASEKPHPMGFCPTGFYVPDWWDVHDGSILPGSTNWHAAYERPQGEVGFVWGCIWGDDTSWKVQLLDLSRVQEGVLVREERFGYLPLATHPKLDPKDFIECYFGTDGARVTFSVLARFELTTGKRIDEVAPGDEDG